jgi:hypothetical protein
MKGCFVAGRWEDIGEELFTLKDRHDREFVLSPVGKQNKVLKLTEFVCYSSFVSSIGAEVKEEREYFKNSR